MQASLASPESLANQKTIAQEVFLTMVGIELEPCEVHPDAVGEGADAIISMLRYSDPSAGAMLIECSPALAYSFTARLMSINRPTSLDADVTDAMGELVNMIGGNLKGLMPEETRVSIPHVLESGERDALLAASTRVSRVCFCAGREHCCVSLLEAPCLGAAF